MQIDIAIPALRARVRELEERLEVNGTPYDGIAARDETIRLLERDLGLAQERLKAAIAVLDAITTPGGQLALPRDGAAMARLKAAFAAAKEVA